MLVMEEPVIVTNDLCVTYPTTSPDAKASAS